MSAHENKRVRDNIMVSSFFTDGFMMSILKYVILYKVVLLYRTLNVYIYII